MPLSVQEKVQLVEAIKRLDPSFSEKCLVANKPSPTVEEGSAPKYGSTKRLDQNMVRLLGQIAPFRGQGDQSPTAWIARVENFLKVFHLTPESIEPYIALYLLDNDARKAYYSRVCELNSLNEGDVNKDGADAKTLQLTWSETCSLVRPLDNPIRRSLLLHTKLEQLANNHDLTDHLEQIVAFSIIERDLDPAPLGDRLYWLLKVCPWSKDDVLQFIDNNEQSRAAGSDTDDALDSILQMLQGKIKNNEQEHKFKHNARAQSQSEGDEDEQDTARRSKETKPCSYCHKTGHRAAHCYKRKKELRGPSR